MAGFGGGLASASTFFGGGGGFLSGPMGATSACGGGGGGWWRLLDVRWRWLLGRRRWLLLLDCGLDIRHIRDGHQVDRHDRRRVCRKGDGMRPCEGRREDDARVHHG